MNYRGATTIIITLICLLCCNARTSYSIGRLKRQAAQPAEISIDENEIVQQTEYNLGESAICGRNGKETTEVISGSKTKPADWPWIAAVLRKEDFFPFCGGTVLTRRHILTAAHCLPNVKPEKILIRLGEYDFQRLNDSVIVDFKVTEIRSHPEYDPSNYENDIAVVKVDKPILYSVYIQPVCLPRLPNVQYTESIAVVAGWGTLFYAGPKSDILMEVAVPVWNQEECVKSFTQPIFATNICAAGFDGGQDSCQGDSGGPLLRQRSDNRWETIGIVSWGIRCGEKNKPGVYTKVNNYLNWIETKIQDI